MLFRIASADYEYNCAAPKRVSCHYLSLRCTISIINTIAIMNNPLGGNVCRACASGKRKYGKKRPHCLRCMKRRIDCHYPAMKPTSFVLHEDENYEVVSIEAGLVALNKSHWSSKLLDDRAQKHEVNKSLFKSGPYQIFAPFY